MADAASHPPAGRIARVLARIAELGNRLPDPITLFVILAASVVVASALTAGLSADVMQRDGTVVTETVQSLLTRDGLRWMLESGVDNFTSFAPLGAVLTVMLGIGVAERSGLVSAALRLLVHSVPAPAITAALVFGGVMSSMAADAGYVVLTPLGAVLFAGLGRHPLAGLAAAFAGVSGGFSANLFVTALDPMLAGLSQEAARTVDPSYTVDATSNYYFMVVSTLLITVTGTLVTSRIVEPALGSWDPSRAGREGLAAGREGLSELGPTERGALKAAALAAVVVAFAVAALVVPEGAALRDPVAEGAPAVTAYATFFGAIEILIAALFFVPGLVYGWKTGAVRSDRDVARMTSDTMATMGSYIVLAFAAAQFVAYFRWTHLGSITAVTGARGLEALGFDGIPLLLAFLVVSATMNLFVGSASAKWAFMAPVFVPMLMYMGVSPEAVQATYRVGDSITNIISPLMPYLPIIIVFAQRYDREAGIGTLVSAMLPYSVVFGIAWTLLLMAWLGLGIPLGPGVSASYAVGG